MGNRYVVLGLGRQGLAAVYDLAKNCDADRVLAFDPDAKQCEAAGQRLDALLGASEKIQIQDSAKLDWASLRGQADVVLSCAPYRFNPEITENCLGVDLPVCDLGGNPEVVSRQEELAKGKSIPVVPECGLAPGMANIAAVHLAKHFGADSIRIRCGGLPADLPDPATNPLGYKLVFDPQGLISEYSGVCPAIEDGKIVYEQACGLAERFDDAHECFATSNNSLPIVEYLCACGVKSFNYKTVRYNGHLACVQGWRSLGFLQGNAERDLQLRELLLANEVLRYDRASDRDRVLLSITGCKASDALQQSWEYRIDVTADEATGFSAMELTTSWGGTTVAHHIASGRGAPDGFATPERFVDGAWFLDEVDRRLNQLS